jgi:hypothetical protein
MKKESYVFDGEDFVLSESVEDNIVLDIIKEGLTFSYAVSFGEDVLKEGVGVTKQAIIKEAHEFMIKKTEEVMLEETQVDRVIDIVKSYVTEGAKSSVRAGFDAKEHADRLFRHSLWKTNHYDYGLRSAQKRKDKGTFDSALNQKMGVNLSKLGDSRLGTKLNAAEHRAVGEHIAKQIESDIDHK